MFITLCLIELAFLCVTLLTEHTLLYNMYKLHSGYVTHSLCMKSLHVFISTLAEKIFSQTVTKQNPGVKKIKRRLDFSNVDLRMPGEWRLRHATLSLHQFVLKKPFLCHC